MPGLEALKGKDWLLIMLVFLEIGEVTVAAIHFSMPWTLWAVVAAIGAMLGIVAFGVQMVGWMKLPAVVIMFIGFGAAVMTFLVRGAT